VEATRKVHLFAYGYFQYASFSQEENKQVVQIQFQDWIVIVKGKGLEPLCAALERLAVERIRMAPEKYEQILKGDGFVEDIEIKKASEWNKAG
jgi:adenylate cyclase class IV